MGNTVKDPQANQGGQMHASNSIQKKNTIPKSPSKSEVRQSNKKNQSSAKINSTAYLSSSRIGSKLKNEQVPQNDKYKLTKLPHFKKEIPDERGEDYAVEKSTVRQSSKINENIKLSWKLDEDDGVSKQANIYSFDYEKALHHFVDWEKDRKERQSVIATSAVK